MASYYVVGSKLNVESSQYKELFRFKNLGHLNIPDHFELV